MKTKHIQNNLGVARQEDAIHQQPRFARLQLGSLLVAGAALLAVGCSPDDERQVRADTSAAYQERTESEAQERTNNEPIDSDSNQLARPGVVSGQPSSQRGMASLSQLQSQLREAGLTQEKIQDLAEDDYDNEEVLETLQEHFEDQGMNEDQADRRAQSIVSQMAPTEGVEQTDRRDEYTQSQPSDSTRSESNQAVNAPEGAEVQESARIALDAEKLNVGKREVAAGGILLRKKVVREDVNEPVELRRETIEIVELSAEEAEQRQREEASRPPRNGNNEAFTEEEIFIPLMREEALVEKEIQTQQVVRAQKQTEVEQREVSATLRREELEVVTQGDASVNRRQQDQSAETQAQSLKQRLEEQLTSESENRAAVLTTEEMRSIQVEVTEQAVTLSGNVEDEETKREIEQKIKQVQGVESVNNNLEVASR